MICCCGVLITACGKLFWVKICFTLSNSLYRQLMWSFLIGPERMPCLPVTVYSLLEAFDHMHSRMGKTPMSRDVLTQKQVQTSLYMHLASSGNARKENIQAGHCGGTYLNWQQAVLHPFPPPPAPANPSREAWLRQKLAILHPSNILVDWSIKKSGNWFKIQL